MALDWSAAAQAQLAGGSVRPGVFMRLATDPVVRLWGGVGDFAVSADLIEDVAGAIFNGFGELIDLPGFEALINGKASRVDLRLSGLPVTSEVASIASTDTSFRNAAVNIGLLVLDADLQPLSPMAWLWDGVADSLTVSMDPDGAGGFTRSLSLSVGSVFTGRRRPRNSYWTQPDQRARSATDAFCDLVANYNLGTTKTWPT